MSKWLMSAAFAAALAAPAAADGGGKPPAPPKPAAGAAAAPDALPHTLAALRSRWEIKGHEKVRLPELVARLEESHGLKVVLNREQLKANGVDNPDAAEVSVSDELVGVRVSVALAQVLAQVNAAYLVRRDGIEVVPNPVSLQLARRDEPNAPDQPELLPPLVSAVIRGRTLADAVAELAEDADATVVVSPAAAAAPDTAVNARLLNVPLPVALDQLACQADLVVVRRGGTYTLTTRDHAAQLRKDETATLRHHQDLEDIRQGYRPLIAAAAEEKADQPKKKPKKKAKADE